jgi:hypothetical protein
MKKKNKKTIEEGSKTAKDGFANENMVVREFNNWKNSNYSKEWLKTMGYNLREIKKVYSKTLHGFKTDVQVEIITTREFVEYLNLQVKLVSTESSGFNQVDKRWIKNYSTLWNIPIKIQEILKLYSGELPHKIKNTKSKKRLFFDEFNKEDKNLILKFFNEKKNLIINDIIKGRGRMAAEWVLVINKSKGKIIRWSLNSINKIINYLSSREIIFTKQGNLKLGNVSLQRKGGDNGRPTANMLQFKINPLKFFDI